MPRLSIITAFYNDATNLPAFRERLSAVLAGLEAEVILIDDHSSDDGPEIVRDWVASDPRVTYLRLSRNCGSHAAFSAGLAECTGDCVILLAADLQDPPETIPQLVAQWREGYDVVWAVRQERKGESWSTRLFARLYYGLMRRIALPEMPSQGADFLLMDRKVVDAYNAIPEKHTSFLAMILWMGFRQTSIEYVKQARHAGRSKWTLAKKLKLFVDSVVSFSYAPIRIMSCFGLAMATCGFLYAAVVIVGRLAGWIAAGTGFAALMTVLLVGQGLILTMLGVLGEYLWRTFDEARGRPRYIVEESLRPTPVSRRPASRLPQADSAARPLPREQQEAVYLESRAK
jgi:polyisoprenyl-phosphate glycosyltransferase